MPLPRSSVDQRGSSHGDDRSSFFRDAEAMLVANFIGEDATRFGKCADAKYIAARRGLKAVWAYNESLSEVRPSNELAYHYSISRIFLEKYKKSPTCSSRASESNTWAARTSTPRSGADQQASTSGPGNGTRPPNGWQFERQVFARTRALTVEEVAARFARHGTVVKVAATKGGSCITFDSPEGAGAAVASRTMKAAPFGQGKKSRPWKKKFSGHPQRDGGGGKINRKKRRVEDTSKPPHQEAGGTPAALRTALRGAARKSALRGF